MIVSRLTRKVTPSAIIVDESDEKSFHPSIAFELHFTGAITGYHVGNLGGARLGEFNALVLCIFQAPPRGFSYDATRGWFVVACDDDVAGWERVQMHPNIICASRSYQVVVFKCIFAETHRYIANTTFLHDTTLLCDPTIILKWIQRHSNSTCTTSELSEISWKCVREEINFVRSRTQNINAISVKSWAITRRTWVPRLRSWFIRRLRIRPRRTLNF
jgi:hypothetical protein